MLIGLKKRKKKIHNPAGREQQTIWFAAFLFGPALIQMGLAD